MRAGDILVYSGKNEYCYTNGKHYKIYKINDNFIPGHLCGWIRDDNGLPTYFRECEAEDNNWHYLAKDRKLKLQKLYDIT